MTSSTLPRITAVSPLWAVEGGQITIAGTGFPVDPLPKVQVGGVQARLTRASPHSLSVIVPSGLDGGRTPIRIGDVPGETAFIEVGAPLATGLHQVDNPAYDTRGNLYVTFSGSRGEQAPVAIYIVRKDGTREPLVSDLPNPTSLAFGPDDALYVSSRFDGSVHRVDPATGAVKMFATDLGVACGIAFARDGSLFVGDRSGSVLRVEGSQVRLFASVPPSVAAFHLAFGPDDSLYVTAPTLASREVVYRISPGGAVEPFYAGFGRPQGLAFDADGRLYVVDALAGASALYRFRSVDDRSPERLVAGAPLIGLAFDPLGGVAVASSDTVYRLNVPITGLTPERS
jgi:sugar lactone lactonase YvrE